MTIARVEEKNAYADRALALVKRIAGMFKGESLRDDVSMRCRQLVAIELVAVASRLLNDALNLGEPEKSYDEIGRLAATCDTSARMKVMRCITSRGLIERVGHAIPDDVYGAVALQALDSELMAVSMLLDRADSLGRVS